MNFAHTCPKGSLEPRLWSLTVYSRYDAYVGVPPDPKDNFGNLSRIK